MRWYRPARLALQIGRCAVWSRFTWKGRIPLLLLRAFAWTAILESLSWIFLLVSMFFTYVVETGWGEEAITLFGRIHGFLVIIYVAAFLACLIRYRFRIMTVVIDVLALFVPGLGFWVAKLAFDQARDLEHASNVTN